jgi:hypothetical protein
VAGVIVLDTNVVSELVRLTRPPGFERWFGAQDAENLYFTAVGEAEVRFGLATLPEGRRRTELVTAMESILEGEFRDRILPFDRSAARAYADIGAERRSAGRPIGVADCQIAAIARSRGAALATRNTRDFEGCGLVVIDPWLGA